MNGKGLGKNAQMYTLARTLDIHTEEASERELKILLQQVAKHVKLSVQNWSYMYVKHLFDVAKLTSKS